MADERAQALNRAIAAEIRAEMGRQNITKRELEIRTGWPRMLVSRRVSGEVGLEVGELEVLAEALGVPAEQLRQRAVGVA